MADATGSSFFSPSMIVAGLAVVGVVAVFVYTYRCKQDLEARVLAQETFIKDLKQGIIEQGRAIAQLNQRLMDLAEALEKSQKKRRATEKRLSSLEEQVYELSETPGKPGKKKIVSREPKKVLKKTRFVKSDSEEEKDTESNSDDDEEEFRKSIVKKNGKQGQESLL